MLGRETRKSRSAAVDIVWQELRNCGVAGRRDSQTGRAVKKVNSIAASGVRLLGWSAELERCSERKVQQQAVT